MVAELKKVGDDKVVLGLSGGVDSTAAVLLHQAIGKISIVFCKQWFIRKNDFKVY
jgi:GMP synthase (glutamine-hydrolysing)